MEAVQTDLKRKKEKKQRKRGKFLEGKSACQKGFFVLVTVVAVVGMGKI